MSITTRLATVAFAATVASLAIGSALANTKGPSAPPHRPSTGPQYNQHSYYGRPHNPGQHVEKLTTECYYLPTMSNGSLSGLEKKCWTHFK